MLGQEEKANLHPSAGPRKTFWRSASWSARSPSSNPNPNTGLRHHPNSKSRPSLPPLQPLSISRRVAVDQWPRAGSDDLGEWPQPPSTPSTIRNKPSDPEIGIEFQLKKDKLAFFNKECSRIADHIYLGSDAVARNRDELRRHGISHVLNCVGFVCPEYFKGEGELVYKTLWLQDCPSEDITSILYDVFDYFEDVREAGGRVFVHCCQGVSRSTSLVIAYLMWRHGQSFEDAFHFVKSARGVTNPNMGFACQLLQCQKRVHAAPVSPSSVLRMYRIAPHSPYDPLHLVPKLLAHPVPLALDSRGAFLVQVPSAIFVWRGRDCSLAMARRGEAAASQVVRYERAKGPIVYVREGEEPSEFWDAFVDGLDKSGREQVDAARNVGVGCKKVELYDVDFEIFLRAVRGGVVPPFPLSGTGTETHLPARENGWGRLRRKLASGGVKEFLTASLTHDKVQSVVTSKVEEASPSIPLVDSSLLPSPPCRSPESFCSDSNASSKSRSKSPSPSPTDSSSSFTFSPTSNWSEFSFSSSQSSPRCPEFRDTFAAKCSSQEEKPRLPYKGSSPSLAERRGSNAPSLKLLSPADDRSQVSRSIVRSWSFSLPSLEEDIMMDHVCREVICKGSHELDADKKEDTEVQIADQKELDKNFCFEPSVSVGDSSRSQLADTVMEDQEPSVSNDLIDGISDLSHPILFQWPVMEKVEMFRAGVLDSRSVFLLLAPTINFSNHKAKMLYVWVGSDVAYDEGHSHLIGNNSTDEDKRIYWEKVSRDFLYQMQLPVDIPVQVVKEADEPMQFLNNINHFNLHQTR